MEIILRVYLFKSSSNHLESLSRTKIEESEKKQTLVNEYCCESITTKSCTLSVRDTHAHKFSVVLIYLQDSLSHDLNRQTESCREWKFFFGTKIYATLHRSQLHGRQRRSTTEILSKIRI